MDVEVFLRWLVRRDMPEVLEIERSCFAYAWTEEDFRCCLRQKNYVGMVAEHEHKIVGVMIYELHKSKLRIINLAVDPVEHRRGIGRQMIRRLVENLSQQGRRGIVLEVCESNLNAQLFFSSQGFMATAVLKGFYEVIDGDAYEFSYERPLDDLMPVNENIYVEEPEL